MTVNKLRLNILEWAICKWTTLIYWFSRNIGQLSPSYSFLRTITITSGKCISDQITPHFRRQIVRYTLLWLIAFYVNYYLLGRHICYRQPHVTYYTILMTDSSLGQLLFIWASSNLRVQTCSLTIMTSEE